jgi:GNAT superfamily N-acetyltransferase
LSAASGRKHPDPRPALAAAYAALFAAWQKSGDSPGQLEEIAGALCSRATGIDEPGWTLYLNQVSGLGVRQPATRQAVDDALSFYGLGTRPFVVAVDPTARPRSLAGWLEERGLRRRLLLARSQRPPEPPAPAGAFPVQDIGRDRAEAYASLAAHGLPAAVARGVAALVGEPGWHHALAYDGPTPIAAGALFVHEGVGCLCWSATHASHRRQGAHAALIAHRVGHAARLGCTTLAAETLEASSGRPGAGLRNLLKAGFQIDHQLRVYVAD